MQQQIHQQPMHQQVIGQQQVMGQQPGVTIITQNPPVREDQLEPSALSQMRVLSILQITMGILCTIFGIILIIVVDGFSVIAYGIWCGLYFVLVGGIGLGAVSANNSCWLVSAMVLNIICSAAFFMPMLSMCATAIAIISGSQYCSSYYYSYYDSSNCGYDAAEKTGLAFNSLMLLMTIAELVITIWSAALCCGAVCSCCKFTQRGQVIQYNPTPMVQTHQQVVYPSVPAPGYGISVTGPQITTQNHYSPYPVAVHQQPVGVLTAQPQGPPGYYANIPGVPAQNQSYQQPPPTAHPNIPQETSNSQDGK